MSWLVSLSGRRIDAGILFASALALFCSGRAFTQENPRGHLVIIGGGERGPEIMRAFVHLAGDEKSKVAIFPMASELAESSGPEHVSSMKNAGAGEVLYLNLKRSEADREPALHLLENVTGVFFTGGDQSRLTAALKGTRVEQRLHELYRAGGVIGGTSAGAAVMNRIMLTGDERKIRDSANAFSIIQRDNVVTAEGFGFLDDAIIDQHFIKRRRHKLMQPVARVVLSCPSDRLLP